MNNNAKLVVFAQIKHAIFLGILFISVLKSLATILFFVCSIVLHKL